jgi:hypothetical protein
MASDLQKAPIATRFDHLLDVISSQRFLRMEGIGKEVPFFVVPYSPTEHLEIEAIRSQLINKLRHKGVRILEINLYDLSKELLEQVVVDGKSDWDFWIEKEATVSKVEMEKQLQNVTDAETKLAPAIASKISDSEFDVLFLSGVGEVFPYIRSHAVLNNLQSVAKSHPMVMFFPGDYSHSLEDGASLDLFGRLHDDKYYRAFNIFERET